MPFLNAEDPQSLLRLSLRGNATFSTLSGSLFSFASAAVSDYIGLADSDAVLSVGLNLLGFAAALLYLASRSEIPLRWVRVVIGLDLAWVVGTVPVVLAGVLSSAGVVAALLIADCVLFFALAQYFGLRRVRAASGRQPLAAAR